MKEISKNDFMLFPVVCDYVGIFTTETTQWWKQNERLNITHTQTFLPEMTYLITETMRCFLLMIHFSLVMFCDDLFRIQMWRMMKRRTITFWRTLQNFPVSQIGFFRWERSAPSSVEGHQRAHRIGIRTQPLELSENDRKPLFDTTFRLSLLFEETLDRLVKIPLIFFSSFIFISKHIRRQCCEERYLRVQGVWLVWINDNNEMFGSNGSIYSRENKWKSSSGKCFGDGRILKKSTFPFTLARSSIIVWLTRIALTRSKTRS